PCPEFERVLNRGHRGSDASIVGDLARAAERDVEVLAHEHALGFQRNVANRKFRHWSFVSGPWSVVLQKAMPAPPYNFVIPVKGPRPSTVIGRPQSLQPAPLACRPRPAGSSCAAAPRSVVKRRRRRDDRTAEYAQRFPMPFARVVPLPRTLPPQCRPLPNRPDSFPQPGVLVQGPFGRSRVSASGAIQPQRTLGRYGFRSASPRLRSDLGMLRSQELLAHGQGPL